MDARFILGSGLVAALLALVAPAHAASDFEISDRYEAHPRPALLRTGSWTLGASYAAAFVAAAASERDADNWLYVPVAGPWLALSDDGDGGRLRQGLLIADGVVQSAGVLQLAGAFVFPELHRVTVEHERESEPPPSFALRAEPWLQGKTVGLRARATF